MGNIYLAIDLKSFYASVECVTRGLDPLNTNLVVADESRTDKTICLAVSPALKSFGIGSRMRLFELKQRVREVNLNRRKDYKHKMIGKSIYLNELSKNKGLSVDYLIAKPRMAYYIKYSSQIYDIYLDYFSSEDMHIYSIDEVFIDVTPYLNIYKCSPYELCRRVLKDVYAKTGITATAGIGTNLYLAKIAMDIVAKHSEADESGVRIAQLDEMSYREKLWTHAELLDFWRVGRGYKKRLNALGLETMGDIARCSLENEKLLYDTFGINAELLIDHAWGIETCSMKDIKGYRPQSKSIGKGQVLSRAYTYEEAHTIVKEMCEDLVLELAEKQYYTRQLVLNIGYDSSNKYEGEKEIDRYGRSLPKTAHGIANFNKPNHSSELLVGACMDIYEKIINPKLKVRRINIAFGQLILKKNLKASDKQEQLSLFGNSDIDTHQEQLKEEHFQNVLVNIRNKYGKNAIGKVSNLKKESTIKERHAQIGGHKA